MSNPPNPLALAAWQRADWASGVINRLWGHMSNRTKQIADDQPQQCPWCTGDAEAHESGPVTYIECSDCHASGPEEENEDEAIRQWNAVASPCVRGDAKILAVTLIDRGLTEEQSEALQRLRVALKVCK